MIKNVITFILLLCTQLMLAQQAYSPEMADAMRADGKIYVVISVLAIIFVAIALFLFFIERRVSKLEREIKTKNKSENQA